MMGALAFAAIGAFLVGRLGQGMMGAAHIAARFRGFFLRNCHGRRLSYVSLAMPRRRPTFPCTRAQLGIPGKAVVITKKPA